MVYLLFILTTLLMNSDDKGADHRRYYSYVENTSVCVCQGTPSYW